MKKQTQNISGWGAYPTVKAEVLTPASVSEVQAAVRQYPSLLARGNGYSYGDSSLNPVSLSTRKLNQVIKEDNDLIEVEAGISIAELLQQIVPRQQFLPVTPGTKAVTIGGAIASDVHGKNHLHKGSFFNTTDSLKIVVEKGALIQCSRTENADLFYRCFGGMGLPGIIVSATIRLMPLPAEMMEERQYIAGSLKELLLLMEQHRQAAYLVAWMDLLGKEFRGIVKTGEWINATVPVHSSIHKKPFNIPFVFPLAPPAFLFRWYNRLYLKKAMKQQQHQLPFDSFFYPLDRIQNWRYVFGPKGLLQYHFLLPLAVSEQGIEKVIQEVKNSGVVCTLAVLKLFGKENVETPQAFAREGFNLALDFMHTKKAVALIYRLDSIVQSFGGNIYKAKDALSTLPAPLAATQFQSVQNQRYENQ